MKEVKKIIIPTFIFFLCLFISDFNVLALENNTDNKLKRCTLSEEYIKWEKLSDEEKQNTIMPAMCATETNQNNANSFNSKNVYSFNLKTSSLPSSYDGRNESYKSIIKDQSNTNGCWAFSTTSALEYYIRKAHNLDYVFSTRHIEYSSTRTFLNNKINEYGYNRAVGSGGNYLMSASYLANGLGPILEDDMPFLNNEDTISINEIQNKNIQLDVNNIVLENSSDYGVSCTKSQIDTIKEYVYTYGSLMITTYITQDSSYYNSSTAAFYYNGSSDINHAVLIVGWDDDYSRTNFSYFNRPSSDGAWIVQNSYGESFGDNGYYYISYEDFHVCDGYMVITDIDEEIEDNAYIHDNLGYNTFYGFNSSSGLLKTAYAMNVFTKEEGKTELLKEITFGNGGTGTYEIYYIEGNAKDESVSNMELIGSGEMDYAGYITHKLDNPIYLSDDITDFSIVVYYNMDSLSTPLPISTSESSLYQYITIDSNKSFASSDGKTWYDLTTVDSYTLIASIKAFSDDINYSLTLGDVNISSDDEYYSINIDLTYEEFDINKLEIVLKDNLDNEIDIVSTNFNNNKLEIILDNSLEGIYYASFYYDDIYVGKKEFVLGDYKVITSNIYTIDQDKLIIYTQPNTSINKFISNVQGIKNNNLTSSNGYIYTGLKVDDYTIVVLGDVNGDGYAKMNDVMKISKYIVDGTGMTKYYQLAADVNLDSLIKMNDVMKISNYIVEGGTL